MAASDAAGDTDGLAPGTAMADLYRVAGTPLCAGGPGLTPRCIAGAHLGRPADCRAVRRVSDAPAWRCGAACLPGCPGTASGGVWQNPRRRLGTGREPAPSGGRVRRAE